MKKHLQKNYKIYLLFLFLSISVFATVFIKNKGIFIFDGDTYQQTFKFYQGGWEKVHSGTLGNWDWSLGFGGNIFSYSLYFITSPVFWFTTLFPKEFIPYSILIANILQFWLGCIFTYHWLNKLNIHPLSSVVGAILFNFCSWNLGYMRYECLLIATTLYPLILYLTEVYLKSKKFLILTLMIGFLGISNYLLLYQFIPFLLIYTLTRYLIINKVKIQITTLFYDGLKFFLIIILGVLLSSFVLFPTAYLIFNMPRFSSDTSFNFVSLNGLREIFKIYSSIYTPIFERQNVNYFIDASQHGYIGWGGGASLFSMILTPLLLPLLICLKDKFKRNCYMILILTGFLFVLFPFFSKLFNFSIDTRWLYMLVLINTLVATDVLDNLIDGKLAMRSLFFSLCFNLIVVFIFFFVSYSCHFSSLENLKYLLKSSFFLLLIMIFYFLIIYKKKYSLILLLLSIEVVYCGYSIFKFNEPLPYQMYDSENHSSNAVRWIKENDSQFYRILYDKRQFSYQSELLDITTANEPLAQNFMGSSFYTSLYNVNQEEFLNRFKSTWFMPQLIGRENIYNLLSAKYFYSYSPIQPVPYGYNLVYETDDYKIYENENYIELGYVCPSTINSSVVSSLSYLQQDQIMQTSCITNSSKNKQIEEVESLNLLVSFADAETRVLEFPGPISKKRLYIENFGIPHLEIYTYLDDKIVDFIDMWQFNYSSIIINENSPIDKLIIKGLDEYGYGTMVNVYEENIDGSYEKKINILKDQSFENVVFKNDVIEADITISGLNKTVFTSIPFDEGWKVYINDVETDIDVINFGFIGFTLNDGEYHVRFEYSAPLFKEGILVSCLSLILLIFIAYKTKGD